MRQLRCAPWLLAALTLLLVCMPASLRSQPAKVHRLVVHVSAGDPLTMNIALNNAQNALSFWEQRGEAVQVEFVAIGPGLTMLRADTSPVKARVSELAAKPGVRFSACGNTRAGMAKAEGHEIPLLPQAQVVPAGIARLMELEEQGWTYVRP